MRRLRMTFSVLVALPLVFAGTARAAIYAKVGSIAGGAMAPRYKDSIEVVSVDIGLRGR